MKPIYLDMTYFGPHEHSVIDFQKLEEAPIFLIGGDTGAGKSTIFDAMTFALFGSTTNDGPDGRAAKDMRSQFAPDDQATSVTFYFEQGNQLYKITRTPEQYLTKKSGKGLTKRATTAKLAIVEAVNGVETDSIASKPVDVAHEITAILNLTADQFKKIILLPQNDFSEFLKSKTTEKETILKKIFGTQLYSDFTKALKDKYDAASKEGQAFENELNVELKATTWTAEEKDQLDHEAAAQRLPRLKTFVDQRQTALAAKTAALDAARKTAQTTAEQLQAAQATQQKFADLAKFKNDYQTNITAQAEIIQQDQSHVTELTWAETLKNPVRDATTKTQELKQTTATQVALTTQVTQAKQAFSAAQEKSATLIARKAEFEAKDQRVQELTSLIPKVQRVETDQAKLAKLQPQVDAGQTDLDRQTQAAHKINQDIAENTAALPSIDELQQQKDALTQQKAHVVETLTPLENAHANLTQAVTDVQSECNQLKVTLTTKQTTEAHAKTDFDQKISERQKWMIAQLQNELQDDQPCVVCGATDHSHMVRIADASETELKASMAAVDLAQDAYASAKKDTETTQQRYVTVSQKLATQTHNKDAAAATLTAKYAELRADSLVDLPATFDMPAIRSQFDQAIAQLDTDLTAAKKLAQTIKDLTAQLQQASEQINTTKLALAAQKAELKSTQQDLEKTSRDIDTSQPSAELESTKQNLVNQSTAYQQQLKQAQDALHASQLTLSTNQAKLDDANEQLKSQQHQLTALKQTIDQALQANDAQTNDMTVLTAWINDLDHQGLADLQVKIARYQQEKTRLQTEINQLETKLADVEQPDVAAIQATYAQQQAATDQAVAAQTIAQTNLDNAQTSYANVQAITHKQGHFAKRFSELMGLYNIVTGKDGNDRKLKLETYVVQSYLQRVLNYANAHFINLLSNNRYTFELAAEGSDKRTDHGLDINVYDNETGASRPSGTLSGGETFIAALSIALSLSEVVQSSSNGVQIDALFVDEGFGSLDDETLTKAMQALETIGQNRMVGVISHIESMKQTIGQQILVKKLGDGRSKVELISK